MSESFRGCHSVTLLVALCQPLCPMAATEPDTLQSVRHAALTFSLVKFKSAAATPGPAPGPGPRVAQRPVTPTLSPDLRPQCGRRRSSRAAAAALGPLLGP